MKEIFSCILLIIDSYGAEGIQLKEIFDFLVFGCGHKAVEVRNESIMVIKQFYTIYGYEILSYLESIKPSTMAVINQELESIELPEHLKAPAVSKEEFDKDELLTSPQKGPSTRDFGDANNDYYISPAPDTSLDNASEEMEEIHSNESEEKKMPRRSSEKPKIIKKNSKLPTENIRRSSTINKTNSKNETREYLTIKDTGDKEERDHLDAKALWSPNELRPDIILSIRDQIKGAFGPAVEKECFSSDFNKHIQCLQLFETAFEPDFKEIDGFF